MSDDPETIIMEADDDVLSRPSETAAEKERSEAFHAGYAWGGKSFEGLSASKKMLCDALCYKAGCPPLNAGFTDLQWFVPMAQAIVFVCATDWKALRRLWGLGIDAVFDAFLEWVDTNVQTGDDDKILDLGQRILIDSRKNQAEAVPSGQSGK
jgi:hypothetical protein